MTTSASELSAVSRLFSSAVFRELSRKGRSPLFRRLIDQAPVVKRCAANATVSDAFEAAFRMLRKVGHRDEYVYRTALTRRVLLGKHSLRTAAMLTEFRTGSCKADVVILNGTSEVYEIKSERDTLVRLANQLENYTRVFAHVNVLASEEHLGAIRAAVPEYVGLRSLSRRYQISVVREATERLDNICPLAVLDSLQTHEAMEILRALGIDVPDVPNTQRRRVLKDLFAFLDPAKLHAQMVQTLKQTRSLASRQSLIAKLPASLHAMALSTSIRRPDHDRLLHAVNLPLEDKTASWG